MSEPTLRTSVRLCHGLFASDPAVLELNGPRISLLQGGERLFDVPVREAERVYWPEPLRLRFGVGHLQLQVAGITYRVAFPSMRGFAGPTTGAEQRNRWRLAMEEAKRT